jgi:hypothetical protein
VPGGGISALVTTPLDPGRLASAPGWPPSFLAKRLQSIRSWTLFGTTGALPAIDARKLCSGSRAQSPAISDEARAMERFAEKLQPFAELYADFLDRIEGASDEELCALFAAAQSATDSNCWFATHRAAQLIMPMVIGEQVRRANAGIERIPSLREIARAIGR